MIYGLIPPAAPLARRAIRALVLGGLFALASCSSPLWKQEEIPAGTVVVDIAGSLASGRTIVADFNEQATKVVISITQENTILQTVNHEKAQGGTLPAQTPFTGLVPGDYTASIEVYVGNTVVGTGSAALFVGTVQGGTVTIPITYSTSGTGTFSFKLQLPSGVSATSLECSWVGIVPSPVVAVTTSVSNGTWTIAGNNVQAGDWTLKILFKDGNNALGFITEVIQVRDGVTTDRWINTNDSLVETRTVTEAELVSSSTSADIVITGLVHSSGIDDTYTETLDSDWTEPTDLLTTNGIIGLDVSPGIPGQNISWKWDGNSSTATTLSIEDDQNSHDLVITVTAPNGETKTDYSITIHRACIVTFNVLNLSGDSIDQPSMQVINKESAAVDPWKDNPNNETTATLWSTKADFSDDWNFNESIGEDTLLYAVVYPKNDMVIPGGEYTNSTFKGKFTNETDKTHHLLGDVTITDSWSQTIDRYVSVSDKDTFKAIIDGHGFTIFLVGGTSTALFGFNLGTIRNLNITLPAAKTGTGTSLLAMSNGGTGEIICCNVSGKLSNAGSSVGGLVASNYGNITNCSSTVEITSNHSGIGGLVGNHDNGTISNSSSNASITLTGLNPENIGGLVGMASSTIEKCSSTSTIQGANATSVKNIGGFIGGINNPQDLSVIDCSAVSTIGISFLFNQGPLWQCSIGGFVGNIPGGTFEGNTAHIALSITRTDAYPADWTDIGGFTGIVTDGILTKNTVEGSISIIGKSCKFAGGFAGSIAKGTIKENEAHCSILANSEGMNSFGGFAGSIDSNASLELSDSHASGFISTTSGNNASKVGGFIGSITGTVSPSISQCYALGNVHANTQYIGGFIGYMSTGSIDRCYAIGNINGYNNVGGFAGYISQTTGTSSISNCYARGNVKAQSNVGGFVGNLASNTTISKCYASGKVSPDENAWGGFAGESSGTITYCYFENKYTTYEGNDFGDRKTTTQMIDYETYRDSWSISQTLGDANIIWGIDTTGFINDGYPYLQCFGAATVKPAPAP